MAGPDQEHGRNGQLDGEGEGEEEETVLLECPICGIKCKDKYGLEFHVELCIVADDHPSTAAAAADLKSTVYMIDE